jgi:hypothetical protein
MRLSYNSLLEPGRLLKLFIDRLKLDKFAKLSRVVLELHNSEPFL